MNTSRSTTSGPEEAGPVTSNRGRRLLAGLVFASILSGVAGWVAGAQMMSASEAAGRREAPEPSLITAAVEQRALAAEVVTRATLVRTSEIELQAWPPTDASVGSVVTAVPQEAGGTLHEGAPALEVGGRPVVALAGDLPSFRDLRLGDTGVDVDQLRAALERLGFLADGSPGAFDEGVVAAVEDLYSSIGYPSTTGGPEAEQALAQAREDRHAAEQALEDLQDSAADASEAARLQADADVRGAQHRVELVEHDTAAAVEQAQRRLAEATAALEAADDALAVAQQRLGYAEGEDLHPDTGDPLEDGQLAELEEEVAAADAALDGATQERDAAEREVDRAELQRAGDLEAARNQLEIAQAHREELLQQEEPSQDALDQARRTLESATLAVTAAEREAAPFVPRSEVVVVPDLPRTVTAALLERGEDLDGPFARVAGSQLQLEASVPASSASVLEAGAVGRADDVAAGIEFPVRVVSVSEEPKRDGEDAGRHGVTLAPVEDPPGSAIGLSLRVRVPTRTSDEESLVVPAAAVVTSPDGSTVVERLDGTHAVPVEVDASLSAAGLVVVEPLQDGALGAGDAVVVGVGQSP